VDIDQTMPANSFSASTGTGGASNSVPQTPEEIFSENLGRFRSYALLQGAYFDEHGYLVYNSKILTRADSEYLAQSDTPFERLLDDSELKALFDNLLDYSESYEVDDDE